MTISHQGDVLWWLIAPIAQFASMNWHFPKFENLGDHMAAWRLINKWRWVLYCWLPLSHQDANMSSGCTFYSHRLKCWNAFEYSDKKTVFQEMDALTLSSALPNRLILQGISFPNFLDLKTDPPSPAIWKKRYVKVFAAYRRMYPRRWIHIQPLAGRVPPHELSV